MREQELGRSEPVGPSELIKNSSLLHPTALMKDFPGEPFAVVEDEARARELTEYRIRVKRERSMAPVAAGASLTEMMAKLADKKVSELPLLIKADAGPFRTGPPDVWRFYLANSGATPMAAVAQRALLVHRLDLRRLLPQIRQPVLMICGDCDPTVNRACEEVLLQGLPNVGRIELSGCGHFPYFTHPEVLAELVRQFLSPPVGCAEGV